MVLFPLETETLIKTIPPRLNVAVCESGLLSGSRGATAANTTPWLSSQGAGITPTDAGGADQKDHLDPSRAERGSQDLLWAALPWWKLGCSLDVHEKPPAAGWNIRHFIYYRAG